ncbi:TPA: hypothetical protein OW314_000505 [Pseudomonas aeruginosa]|nr:hypothetical protein [Pseudomonas aeruginosa]MBV6198316.1 hypothetical protein [Pseudomonas aeruginosa]HBN8189566.1 hypothetical protein [Pseudomonas aeruginosa]HCE6018657.1 hypothetical protein [Pseudomonas aeruginosa]HCW0202799.1 hypothetical protein [Pseudomonas aeruginosa]
MNFQEILTFLLPSVDPLQLLFAGLIGILSLVTVIALKRGAREQTWERKWNGGGQDDLDVEHGSVNEISAAVASPGEKMIEFMPGILLILGLLGTFLGLGIALNKASTILVEANAGGGMDNAMTNLMGMMEGLGTKFKTSTWGILAFLLLKAYAASNGYEERRLRWCVGQMKRAFDSSRLQRQGERQQAQATLLETLGRLDQNLAAQNESQRQLLELQARLVKHHAATTQQALADNRSSIDALLLPLKASLEEQQAGNQTLQGLLQEQQTGNQNLQKLQKDQLAANQIRQALVEETQAGNQTRQALVQEAQAGNQVRQDVLQAQQASGKTLASALPALHTLNSTGEKTLTALGAIDARLQEHGEQNQQQLEDGRATRQAMEHLIDSNSRNLAAISGAAEQMASAAGTIGVSAGDLQQAIADFKEGVAGVLGHLKQDLGETIGLMGSSFTDNMTQMSASLSEATLGISSAVNSLSNNVGQTMEGMKKSNEESLNLQRNAHASFQGSSETLQVNVEGMTHLVGDLREKILSGLKAVSESGRRMVALDSRYEGVTQQAELAASEIKGLVAQLMTMQHSSPLQPAVDALAARVDMIGRNLQEIDQNLEVLSNVVQHNQQRNTGGEISQSLREIIAQLHVLDRAQPTAVQIETAL